MSIEILSSFHAIAWIMVYSLALVALILSLLLARCAEDWPLRSLAFRESYAVAIMSLAYLAQALGLFLPLSPTALALAVAIMNGALLHSLVLITAALPPFVSLIAFRRFEGGLYPGEIGKYHLIGHRSVRKAGAATFGLVFGVIFFISETSSNPDFLRSICLMLLAIVTVALTVAVCLSVFRLFFSRAQNKWCKRIHRLFAVAGGFCFFSFLLFELAPQFCVPIYERQRPTYFFLAGFFLTLNGGIVVFLLPRIATFTKIRGKSVSASNLQLTAVRLGLSAREAEVAELLAVGASYKDIAEKLFVSVSTIQTHVTRVYAKLGIRNKVELANRLRKNGNAEE